MKRDTSNQQYHQHWRKKKKSKKNPYRRYNHETIGKIPKQPQKTTIAVSADSKTGHHHTNARQKRQNAKIATKWDTLQEFAAVKPIRTRESKKPTTWKKHTPKKKKVNQKKYNKSRKSIEYYRMKTITTGSN